MVPLLALAAGLGIFLVFPALYVVRVRSADS